jgi:tripartite-type tricarboxylate transporter receptor subunit TctC
MALGLAGVASGARSTEIAGGKPVRIMVGFPPGQATDSMARLVAERLGTALGQPVIVENRPGQGGSMVIGLVADLPVKSVAELVAYAKSHPKASSNPSSGNGTLSHLMMEDFKQRAGIEILHVPCQGSSRAMSDLVAGNVQVGLDTLSVTMPLVQAGKLRLLAVGTSRRPASMPDVPTIAELGFPGFEALAWVGLTTPAGTPREVRERIHSAVEEALASPDFVRHLSILGAIPKPGSIDDFAAMLGSENARWGEVVRRSGVQID